MFWVYRAEFSWRTGKCHKGNLGQIITSFGLLLCFHLVSKRFLVGDYGALPSLRHLSSLLPGSHKFKCTGAVSSEIIGPHVKKAIK